MTTEDRAKTNQLRFRDYVLAHRITNTISGDFTRDAQPEARLGRLDHIDSWLALRRYLEHCNACPMAIEAGYRIWRGYLRAKSNQPAGRRADRQ